jgi:hypothetical protein
MQDQATHASGHVFCVQRKRGPQWYCKYERLAHDARQTALGASRTPFDCSPAFG